MLAPVAIIATTTYATTYISFEINGWLKNLPDWLAADNGRASTKANEIEKVLVGALNALIAALWLDNAKAPTGKLWPSGQVKAAFEKTFRQKINEMKKKEMDERKPDPRRPDLERAVSDDQAGWDYEALIERARSIQNLTKDLPQSR
ncbi:hypothetical protein [Rhizobium terrae]|uniref:hypothetical protein n=1 Tax=Rhizobium terrae TaxID=2171756 RepID=UPI0013C3078B|nr:hypothetical protein [Rhizobium terrae]